MRPHAVHVRSMRPSVATRSAGLAAVALALALTLGAHLRTATALATIVAFPLLAISVMRLWLDARLSQKRRADLEQAARAAAAGEARFRALLESAPDGIMTVGSDGRILLVNSQAERLFGYDRREFVGQSVELLLPEHLRAAHASHRRDFHADPRTRPMGVGLDLVGRRKDGSEFPTEISLSPFRTEEGQAVIVVVRDITERRRAEEGRALLMRERAARAEAEAASRAKDELLAVVSHELRTPLNAIVGWTSLMRSRSLDERASARALEVIERNAQAQRQVVDDLLDVSGIMAGKIRLSKQVVDVAQLAKAVIDSIRPNAEAKRLRVDFTADPRLPPVFVDPTRLQQIFWNLVTNAVKFTPEGGAIRVEAHQVDSRVQVTVTDTGIGIDAAFLPHVFDRFRQRDSSTTRAYGGLGLGLALVNELVTMHGGTVTAASAGENRGTRFTVELPAMSQHGASRTRGDMLSDTGAAPDLSGIRVLMVDDEADSRDVAEAVLASAGAQVTLAASAGDALGELSHATPDVLVSDIAMPDLDGYELLRAVRARGLSMPAIAITAYAGEQERQRAEAAGYDIYMTKPVRPNDLLVAVARLARRPAHAQ